MTEQEFRKQINEKAKNVKTRDDLEKLLDEVTSNKNLDYGTIVWAICGCMKGTMSYINNSEAAQGGITGFQAGFIGWDMVREFLICGDCKTALTIFNFDDMLYPQNKNRFKKTISHCTFESLIKAAKENLKNIPDAHPKVLKHWKKIAKGKVPFGYKVVND